VLLAATLLVQLATQARPELWLRHGIVPAAPSLSGLAAHLFLHAGWLHLFGTLACVALAGPWLEAKLGRALFVMTYLAAGLAGATLFVATHPASPAPWIGGSAAVAGLLGALVVAVGRGRMELLGVAAGLGPSLRAPGWALAAFWLGRELAGFAGDGSGGLLAHIGGFGFGALLALGLRKTGVIEAEEVAGSQAGAPASRQRGAAAPRVPVPSDPAQLEALLGESADVEIARAFLARAEADGQRDAARHTLAKRLFEALEWRRREPAVALGRVLVESALLPRGALEPMLQLAGWLRGAGHGLESSKALHTALAGADPLEAGKIARAARRADPVIAYRAAERALGDETLGPSDRKALEGLLVEAEREVASRGIILIPGAKGARTPELPPPLRMTESPSPARPLRLGEAIEIESEPAPVPVALPDPAQAGDAAFLDAFHAALAEPEAETPKPEQPPLRRLRVREAVPKKLEDDAIVLEVPGRDPVRLRFARIHAVALVGVRGLSERAGDKPVLLVDLCLSAEAEPELSALRLRSDRFDPRRLSQKAEPSPLKALRALASTLALRAHAVLLPEAGAAGEAPLRIFPDLDSYQREVLRAR
jgi:membrane associated rhomboid family serine protease